MPLMEAMQADLGDAEFKTGRAVLRTLGVKGHLG